ncbi:serine protease [Candidatus Kaiserbacteria bacterium]|nr:serine protease [Candidatus Kaiserbacteria bacterium]
MDIEHLTKHQIILLTLLVSFVTSIATGIVTVSLMDQAPPSVMRTINQIVEHTIERVVPAATPASPAAAVAAATVTKETTVVVKDDDLAAQSIAKVQKGIVRIVSKNTPDILAARGVVINQKGVVFSDRNVLESLGTVNFEAILPNGTRVPAVMRIPTATSTIAVLDLTLTSTSSVSAVPLADSSKLQLGQSVIRIGGTGSDTIGTGVIAKLPDTHTNLIEASVLSTTPGSIIITLFGEVIGIITGDSAAVGADFYTLATSP